MAVSSRTVKNKRNSKGELTGRPGTVYDVNIKYKAADGKKTYSKKGFSTKKEATEHESEMRLKLTTPSYTYVSSTHGKQTVKTYLEEWVENHNINLRPSTYASYKSHIKNHIVPHIGHVLLCQLSPAMLDGLYQTLFDRELSQSTVRYVHRILSVSMEGARKYHYIELNPARDILTKFGKQGKTPEPYTIELMKQLIGSTLGTELEMPVILAGLYGLRISEVIGLRWNNVDVSKMQLAIVEQMPFKPPTGIKVLEELAPTKSNGRVLPITEATLCYFEKRREVQARQKSFALAGGSEYFDNNFVVSKPNGEPLRRDRLSASFRDHLRRTGFRHIRFHDLRHTTATCCHGLTGDYYTVGEILGHTLKGIGMTLGISTNLETITAQYIDVGLERKKTVLDAYHNALHTFADETSL